MKLVAPYCCNKNNTRKVSSCLAAFSMIAHLASIPWKYLLLVVLSPYTFAAISPWKGVYALWSVPLLAFPVVSVYLALVDSDSPREMIPNPGTHGVPSSQPSRAMAYIDPVVKPGASNQDGSGRPTVWSTVARSRIITGK